MKKILFYLFLMTASHLASLNNIAQAEIIDVEHEEKNFGDWKVFCETDKMMSMSHCKIAAKFYDNSSVITIEPTTKFVNQLFVIIPQLQSESFVKIRVDQNDLILSKNARKRDFGLVELSDDQKNILFSQMKLGEALFLRFNIKNEEKEITVKLNLNDFRKALDYFNKKRGTENNPL